MKLPADGDAFGRALYHRMAVREERKLQGRFLGKLARSPYYNQFVLCGSAALHGVYLSRRLSGNIDLYAPLSFAPRFYGIATSVGIDLEKRRTHNTFVLADRSSVLPDMRIGVSVVVQPFAFQVRQQAIFDAANSKIAVNVLPLADLAAQKLLLIVKRHNVLDALDLWLALGSSPDMPQKVGRLLRSNRNVLGSQLFSFGYMLARLDLLEETWHTALNAVIHPVPSFDCVKRDLISWLPLLQMPG